MKKMLLPVLLFIFVPSIWNKCFNQSKNAIPQNYPGLFVGVELNTTSILVGAEYEVVLWKKNRFTVGIKGTHVFTYGNGNLIFFVPSSNSSSSLWGLMPTVHYFTAPDSKSNRGFFLHSGLGVGWRHESNEQPYYRNITCFEAGLGFQFNIGSGTKLKWTNTILFAGPASIALSKISLGF